MKRNMKSLQQFARRLWREEEGIGTLEMILILAVVLMLAVAFRKWIISWFQKLLDNANTNISETNTDTIKVPPAS